MSNIKGKREKEFPNGRRGSRTGTKKRRKGKGGERGSPDVLVGKREGEEPPRFCSAQTRVA